MSRKFLARVLAFMFCLLFAGTESRAVIISPFPGLDELIEKADAIVILRVDEHVSPMMGPDLYSVHRCLIYQSLKGDIEQGSRVVARLMDTRTSFERPLSLLSTHLVFLMRDRSGSGAEYRMMPIEGANIRLSPFGHETMSEGETPADRVRSLIEASIAYWEKVERADRTFTEGEPRRRATGDDPVIRQPEWRPSSLPPGVSF